MQKEEKPGGAQPFALKFIEPYKTFKDGKAQPIPYVIDGLLTQGGLSVLGGKPKSGKSSLTRYEAVCIAKGQPFLGRACQPGEVIIVNLEDPMNHVDNCLSVLKYDPAKDANIRIVDKVAPTAEENIQALNDALAKLPDVRLVLIDTLAKFIRVVSLDDYMPVLTAVEQLHRLARAYPKLHIQAATHCKKVRTEDPFDGLLGSTALRGEPDTNIAIYGEDGQRVVATETRIGRNIAPTLLKAQLVESAGADVVKNFSLDVLLSEAQQKRAEKTETKRKLSHQERIIAYLSAIPTEMARQSILLDEVEGKNAHKLLAIQNLIDAGVLKVTGKKQSPADPLTLHLNRQALPMLDFINNFGGAERSIEKNVEQPANQKKETVTPPGGVADSPDLKMSTKDNSSSASESVEPVMPENEKTEVLCNVPAQFSDCVAEWKQAMETVHYSYLCGVYYKDGKAESDQQLAHDVISMMTDMQKHKALQNA